MGGPRAAGRNSARPRDRQRPQRALLCRARPQGDIDLSRLPQADNVERVESDLESGNPWPLAGRRFGGVTVTKYLHRPLMPDLLDAIEPGGVLLYETFMEGNQRFGRPSRPEHLLKDGELLELVRGKFSVVAYEARLISEPHMAMVQRIAARRL